jgi:proton-dependent oligopeptide transporter, POT family
MRHKHPRGLFYMGALYMLVAFSFGTINSLLILYLTHAHMSQTQAYSLFAAFNSMVFTLPVPAGYMAEKLGYHQSIIIGMLFCAIGAWVFTIPTHLFIYLGLAIFAFGLATSATASYCIIDISYTKDDTRRESGFTLFYLLFNVGFLLAAGLGGFITKDYGYADTFRIAAAAVSLSLIGFLALKHKLIAATGRSFAPQVSWSSQRIYFTIILISIAFSLLGVVLLLHEAVNNIVLWILTFAAGIGIMALANKQTEEKARMKLFVFLFLCIVSVAFWSLYMLEPSLLTVFIKTSVDRHAFGTIIPPSTFYGLDPIYIILFGLVLSLLWRKLAEKNKDLSLPTKFILSLVFMGVGYLVFCTGIHFANKEHLVNMGWVISGYWFLSIAELLISPIGLSMVGRLSPEGSEGVLMGIWQLFVGLSAIISGYIATTTTTTAHSIIKSNSIYAHSLLYIGLTAVIVGLLAAFAVPTLKRLST